MIVRKLRLQRGWSQETLAEMAGVSVRTIQRIERGNEPGLETAKALAAVFEVPFTSLRSGDDTMNTNDSINLATSDTGKSDTSDHTEASAPTLDDDEKKAMQYVKGLKEFYTHAGMYAVFLLSFIVLGRFTEPKVIWGFLGWGLGVVLHGLVAYEVIGFFSAGWEKRMVEKKLGRKL